MRPALTSEAFASREQKLFARTVDIQPRRRSGFLQSLIGAALFLAVAFTIIGVLS